MIEEKVNIKTELEKGRDKPKNLIKLIQLRNKRESQENYENMETNELLIQSEM